jgi:imidazolonepropionase
VPVLRNLSTLYTCAPAGGQQAVHPVPRAALAWEADTIRWVGPEDLLPPEFRRVEQWDAGGRIAIPGLIDCHTHLAFGGWRAQEFEQRLLGRSYLEIARDGGGIAATVAATRATPDHALLARCQALLHEMATLGVTTVECKSGYGLDCETELRLLRLYRTLAARSAQRLIPTFLGAHVVPPEYRDRREEYVALVVETMLPAVAQEHLASFCDVFVEEGAFTVEEARRVLKAAQALGLGAKLHADQLSDSGGASLAGELGAVSADHLEHVSAAGIRDLALTGVVAVSLPIATLYLQQPPLPARTLIEAGVPVAVATDFNPGTAPSPHLPLALLLACTLQRMTPAEALKGATIYAARALGLDRETGSLEPGKRADFAVLDAESVTHWLYHFRANACVATVAGGVLVWGAL